MSLIPAISYRKDFWTGLLQVNLVEVTVILIHSFISCSLRYALPGPEKKTDSLFLEAGHL
jgi:hypothetical protein